MEDVAERGVSVFLPVLTAVVGGLWAVWLFTAAQADAEKARLIEARKPFLQWQLDTIKSATKFAGIMIIPGQKAEDLQGPRNQLEEWLYSDLSAVGDEHTKRAIDKYLPAYVAYKTSPTAENLAKLKDATRVLGQGFQETLKNGWKT